MKYLIVVFLFVLVGCGATRTETPVAYGTVLGYDEVTTGDHVTKMDVFDRPAGAPGGSNTVGYIYEGDRVAILEQRSDGTIRIRTPKGAVGWIQIDYLKDVRKDQ